LTMVGRSLCIEVVAYVFHKTMTATVTMNQPAAPFIVLQIKPKNCAAIQCELDHSLAGSFSVGLGSLLRGARFYRNQKGLIN
jgi:hypothetical protein